MDNSVLIQKAISFIQSNPKENLSLQSIAGNAGFSLNYFDSVFRKHTGYTPVEYSRIYKLTRSALSLRTSEQTVLEIALDYGYASPESFTRAFKGFYGVSPAEYRSKYSDTAVTWKELSGKVAIQHFMNTNTAFKPVDKDTAIDFCLTRDFTRFAADITEMSVTECQALTLGDPNQPEHLMYISDYNSAKVAVTFLCIDENDALLYLKALENSEGLSFSVREPVDAEWSRFDKETDALGFTCKYTYDMMYPKSDITVPVHESLTVRELFAEDIPLIQHFCRNGGCSDCHINAFKIAKEGKGNQGLRGFGLFKNGEMICYALPQADVVRNIKKYDIGGIFTIKDGNSAKASELIWKHIIDVCLKEGALIGNDSAKENDSVIGVTASERMGMIKTAKNCRYTRA